MKTSNYTLAFVMGLFELLLGFIGLLAITQVVVTPIVVFFIVLLSINTLFFLLSTIAAFLFIKFDNLNSKGSE